MNISTRTSAIVLIVVMIVVIVAVDFLFLKHRFGERLAVNIGIVLVFGIFYLVFMKHA